ncbi:CopG family transcriptional regulator [Kocuria rosea]|uniref:CopG family transcriptional regulator n=1 Tax=Kocuria rosea TaxID=1275 RepID=UPI00203D0ECB|nr:CopG family transcriptional regulator [Kocuria rosea]
MEEQDTFGPANGNGARPGRGGNTKTQERLNVNINAQTADELRELRDERKLSYTEAVRRAIGIYKFFMDEIANGRKIQTMDRDGGNKRDVVLM